MSVRLIAALAASSLASIASAAIVITEASSTGSSGSVGSDWFEITNLGLTSVDITGWRVDDNSNSFAASLLLNGVTNIAPGESVLFLETAAGANIPAFRALWGQIDSVQIGYYSGSGIGLGSGGDAVNIFDSTGVLVNAVTFGAAVQGVSFGYDPISSSFGAPSVAGVAGARISASGTDVGSPGVIPAPSAAALLAIGGIMTRRRRR